RSDIPDVRPRDQVPDVRPPARPSISSRCSINGLGRLDCTFDNAGTGRGRVCLSIVLSTSTKGGIYGDFPICSGIVEPGDVRQISEHVSFHNKDGVPTRVDAFCAGMFGHLTECQ